MSIDVKQNVQKVCDLIEVQHFVENFQQIYFHPTRLKVFQNHYPDAGAALDRVVELDHVVVNVSLIQGARKDAQFGVSLASVSGASQ